MKKVFIALFALSVVFVACGGGAEVKVYHRADVDTAASRIVVFPMLLCNGTTISSANGQYSNPVADALLTKSWAGALGVDNAISIPKIAFDKIPLANDAINVFIHALDASAAVEQSGAVSSFINGVKGQFGDGALAFALVFQDKAAYDAGKVVQLNIGLFDTKKMTWKWITKHGYKAGLAPVPYEKVVSDLVDESLAALQKQAGSLR